MALQVEPWHIVAFTIGGLAFVMGVALIVVYCCCNSRRRRQKSPGSPPSHRLLTKDHVVNDMAETPAMFQEGKQKSNPLFSRHSSIMSSDSNASIGGLSQSNASMEASRDHVTDQEVLLPVPEASSSESTSATTGTQDTAHDAGEELEVTTGFAAVLSPAERQQQQQQEQQGGRHAGAAEATANSSVPTATTATTTADEGASRTSHLSQPSPSRPLQSPDRPQSPPIHIVTSPGGGQHQQQQQQTRATESHAHDSSNGASGSDGASDQPPAQPSENDRAAKLRAMREARARRKKDEWATLEESLAIIDRIYKDVIVSDV
ncbi:hypothetical protein PTSG_00630 [Salpingoeca rosetta]|uniref:Uncharacterized protein n=1 Tax=Salpingoeca rosetta (strain ATCC 50818 / BSB-021) TaxID=946362 RepID=F2TX13_SALR5|nr:uncharacterized protein PTSG_00630 [Salpingoeca rosetta]EGD75922.1 hypothetical protein PTSG_00630 [Salpingoeca rosetta]|eukprot:XP_004998098.1 hypothetical protein PTSG_00630 [Salpingoeca rosetta]